MTVEWDAEITATCPASGSPGARSRARRSTTPARVRFVPAPGDQGTELHVDMRYSPPAGAVGATIAKLFGEEPRVQLKDDLRRFKKIVETGEIVRSDGSPEGPLGQAPAQAAPGASAARGRARGRRDERRRVMRATVWSGRNKVCGRERPGSEDPQRPRRDREDLLDRDLRLGPAPLRRLHPDDAQGRHPRPRVHGRGRRDRPRRRRTSRWATASSCRSRSPAAPATPARASCARCARTPTPTRRPPRSCGATRRAGSSATRTRPAATPAGRPSTRACRSPTSGRSRSTAT